MRVFSIVVFTSGLALGACYQHAEFSGDTRSGTGDTDEEDTSAMDSDTGTVTTSDSGAVADSDVRPETSAETAVEPETSAEVAETETTEDTGPEAEVLACSGQGDPCEGVGECGPGTIECHAGGDPVCSTDPLGSASEALQEICDDRDNDCDGASDEGLTLLTALSASDVGKPKGASCGAGVCAGGRVACAEADGAVWCDSEGAAGDESCNGEDDDCDGDTDEGFAAAGLSLDEPCGPCTLGRVVCAGDGSIAECSAAEGGADRPEHVGGMPAEGYLIDHTLPGFMELGLDDGTTQLQVISRDRGSGAPLTMTGSYELGTTATDRDPWTCGGCALIYQDEKAYFAMGGTVWIDRIDLDAHTIRARIEDATFVQVTLDVDNRVMTEVAGGDEWCVPAATIDAGPECLRTSDCADPELDRCNLDTRLCGQCVSPLDCSPDQPVCHQDVDRRFYCRPGPSVCVGDDEREQGDDGPLGATSLEVPDEVDASICRSEEPLEDDWFVVTLTEETDLEIMMTWDGDADLDFAVWDAALGQVSQDAVFIANPEVTRLPALAAGSYYIQVRAFQAPDTTAIPYRLTTDVFSEECSDDEDCLDPSTPACNDMGLCAPCVHPFHCSSSEPGCFTRNSNSTCASLDFCTDDDSADDEVGPIDDGPLGATVVTETGTFRRRICGAGEQDWYRIDIEAGDKLGLELSWTAGGLDLNMLLLKETLELISAATGTSDNPEKLSTTSNTAQSYYLYVYAPGIFGASESYTLTVTID